MITASKELHLSGLGHVIEESYASRAQNASLLIEHNHRTQVDHFSLAHVHSKRDLAGVKAVDHVVVLQPALACLIVDRTIDRMINQQELQYAANSLLDSLVLRAHNHAFVHQRCASRRELGHLLDVDKTHSAIAVDWQIGVIAIVRDLYAVIFGSLNDGLARFGFHLLSV